MGIKAFYRTPVAYVVTYGAYVNGIWTEDSEYVWTTCNVQPCKEGLVLNISDIGKYYSGHKKFYFKSKPEVTLPDGAEEDAVYIYYNNEFYQVQGNQDWSVSGRAPKHFKFMGIVADPQPDIEEPQ